MSRSHTNKCFWLLHENFFPIKLQLQNLIPYFLKIREDCWKSKICCCKFQFCRSSLYSQWTSHASGISNSHLHTYILIPANELSNSQKTEHLIGAVYAGGILAKALTFSNSTWVSFLDQTQHLSHLSNLLAILRGQKFEGI